MKNVLDGPNEVALHVLVQRHCTTVLSWAILALGTTSELLFHLFAVLSKDFLFMNYYIRRAYLYLRLDHLVLGESDQMPKEDKHQQAATPGIPSNGAYWRGHYVNCSITTTEIKYCPRSLSTNRIEIVRSYLEMLRLTCIL